MNVCWVLRLAKLEGPGSVTFVVFYSASSGKSVATVRAYVFWQQAGPSVDVAAVDAQAAAWVAAE